MFITWRMGSAYHTTGIRFFEKSGDEFEDITSEDDIPDSMSIYNVEKSIDGGSTYIKGTGATITAKILEMLDYDQYEGADAEDDLMGMINKAGSNMSGGVGTATKKIGDHKVTLIMTDNGSEGVEEVFTIKF